MFSVPLLLLLAAASCVNSEDLSQPDSTTVQPGQTLTITCKVSYSLGSYYTAWIRQPAGKGLEWIGMKHTGNTLYKDSLKNKFSITLDSSSKTVTLNGQNMQPEDTAVYYCARYGGGYGAFDYWGKGTTVTVSAGSPVKPTVFPLTQCGSGTGDILTLGCLATGFSPAALTFEWTDPSSSSIRDFIQYPAVQSNGKYTAISQVNVKKQDWEPNKLFSCTVKHSTGEIKKEFPPAIPPTPKPEYLQGPSLFVMTPSKEEINDNQTASFACFARDFAPSEHAIRWTRKGQTGSELSKFNTSYESGMINGSTLYSATSYLQVRDSDWTDEDVEFVCIFEHKTGNLTKSVKYSSSDAGGSCTSVTIEIVPPSVEDLFLYNEDKNVVLACHVQEHGSSGLQNITWKDANDQPLTSQRDDSQKAKHLFIAKLHIPYQEWVNGAEFTCEVEHQAFFGFPEVKKYRRDSESPTSGFWKAPSVFLLAPAEQTSSAMVSLTCYAKDFYPKEVLVTWLIDDKPVAKNSPELQSYTTSTISTKDGMFSVYSQLTMPTSDWDASQGVYSCVVYHESVLGTSTNMLVRTIDHTSKKPSLVNLSLNIPQTCKAQ